MPSHSMFRRWVEVESALMGVPGVADASVMKTQGKVLAHVLVEDEGAVSSSLLREAVVSEGDREGETLKIVLVPRAGRSKSREG
ncbi:MAG: hypothetical protein HRU74_02025 [Chthonomonadaceae bacterium]|nr:MAG: hypothetical protein HRU74_02025 [Chthonomonadaceae bacterium]